MYIYVVSHCAGGYIYIYRERRGTTYTDYQQPGPERPVCGHHAAQRDQDARGPNGHVHQSREHDGLQARGGICPLVLGHVEREQAVRLPLVRGRIRPVGERRVGRVPGLAAVEEAHAALGDVRGAADAVARHVDAAGGRRQRAPGETGRVERPHGRWAHVLVRLELGQREHVLVEVAAAVLVHGAVAVRPYPALHRRRQVLAWGDLDRVWAVGTQAGELEGRREVQDEGVCWGGGLCQWKSCDNGGGRGGGGGGNDITIYPHTSQHIDSLAIRDTVRGEGKVDIDLVAELHACNVRISAEEYNNNNRTEYIE